MARKIAKKLNNSKDTVQKLIILGVLLFSLGTINHYQLLLAPKPEEPKQEAGVAEVPSSISISSISLDIPVIEGGIKNGQWILSDDKALYLPTSGKIGEGFNTIIYAHNTNNLFGSLKNIKQDDLVILRDKQGKEFKYKVFLKEDIDPRDLNKLYSEEKNIVTLFTCDGWFDKERLLVRARLVPPIPSTRPE